MKKVLFALVALVGIISSCTNDDITISRAITFKVNPATVVENLYERNAGDLTSLSSGAKLQVSLYIYDEKGILVDKATNEYSAYTHMMTADINLASGNYTAVATSYVTSSVDYWSFSGLDQLSTFKITDNGYIGGKSKILGLTIMNFPVANNSETININIENAGAVALVYLYQWNKYNNVLNYRLMGKQACDYITFDNYGSKDYSIKSESSYRYILYKHNYDSNYANGYGYFFTFPIRNASFRFYAETTDNQLVPMGKEFVDDVKVGETYAFEYDFETDEATWYDMTPNSTRAISNNDFVEKLKSNDNNRIIYDNEEQSISIQ